MKVGFLVYNEFNNRYAIISKDEELVNDGLHCGDSVEVFHNGEWVHTRMEMSWDLPGEWYLTHTGLKGSQLQGLKVRNYSYREVF